MAFLTWKDSQMGKRYTEAQITAAVSGTEMLGADIRTAVRKHTIAQRTFFR